MLAWKAAKEVPTRILVASADVGALGFMVERGEVGEFGYFKAVGNFVVDVKTMGGKPSNPQRKIK